ncbi:ComEC/Rec2 family competence protein [Leucobacter allii]|uniref:ComEC/Rec2 family competence protein n=1 Tax=Leucobacter allii TaxID=2932247 RepID=UPI001FCFE4C3|nr:ComEC/Rec2 family competence protein [Leucobacter allii]UOR03251.1 ComEC/Rec2 family competence protein [Leucobacter allii]
MIRLTSLGERERSPPGTWRLLAPALIVWAAAAWAIGRPGVGGAMALFGGIAGCAVIAALAVARVRRRSSAHRDPVPGDPVLGDPVLGDPQPRDPVPRGSVPVPRGPTTGSPPSRGPVPRASAPADGERRRATGAGRASAGALLLGCAMLLIVGVRISGAEALRADPALAGAADSGAELERTAALSGYPEARTGAGPGAGVWVDAELEVPGGAVPVVLWLADGEPDEETLGTWAPGRLVLVTGRPVAFAPGSGAAYGIDVSDVRDAGSEPGGPGAREDANGGVGGRGGRLAAALRTGLREAAALRPGAQLVPGFAVGDTSLVSPALEQRMLETSLTHLLAVSGANCGLVIGAMLWLVGRLGAGRRLRIVVAAGALGGFVIVVGPDASVERAAVMAAVLLASDFGGKRAVALPALGCAIVLLLVGDPWQALHPGFALSVVATGGILLFVPEASRLLGRAAGPIPLPRWCVLPVAVALVAQIVCAPLLLLLQPGIPAVGVLANAIAAPAAPLGTGLGLIALLVLPVSEGLGDAVLALAELPSRWVVATAEITASLPFARWPWPSGWAGAALLVVIELAAGSAWLLASRRISGSRNEETRGGAGTPRPGPRPWASTAPLSRPIRVIIAVLGCAALGGLLGPTLVAPVVERATIPADWIVVACDVGQGDALLLRDPRRPGEVMLVDTGDDPERLTSCLQRFGVRRVALAVLTHDDRDHVGALPAVAERIDRAIIAPDSREDAEGGDRELPAVLARFGIPATVAAAGLTNDGTMPRGSAPATTGGTAASAAIPGTPERVARPGTPAASGMRWEVLAPASGRIPADTNAASLVLRVTIGETVVLLLADTGAEEQAALRASGAVLGADIVKVAHHGSRDQDPALYAAVGAAVALVSVGADNGYGHPTAETLALLRTAGAAALRTDVDGTVAVSGPQGELRVWTSAG